LEASYDKLEGLHAPEPFLGGDPTDLPPRYYFLVYLFATLPLGLFPGVLAWFARSLRERDRAALIVLAWLTVPLLVAFSPVPPAGVRNVMRCLAVPAMMCAAGLDAAAVTLDGLLGRSDGPVGRPATNPGRPGTGASQSMRISRGRLPFLAFSLAISLYL